jgi:NAD(P)H-dependent flavin oxidoreductase YrpB (nitropropane dioxygenase family)
MTDVAPLPGIGMRKESNMPRASLAERFGLRAPIFAFSDSAEVVAAVSCAGGFGVLGAISYTPAELDDRLTWIDQQTSGAPYGVDIVIPAKYEGQRDSSSPTPEELRRRIPDHHLEFARRLLAEHGVDLEESWRLPDVRAVGLNVEEGFAHLEVAVAHSVAMVVNALGSPPRKVVDAVHDSGGLVGGLVGTRTHAERQLAHGVDVIIAQGSEAGGHCGEIGTMVLVPEIVDIVDDRAHVLAAGGIGCGRQVAAALALGAEGVWTGSMWLMTDEFRGYIDDASLANLVGAGSGDTVRSRAMSGKPMRQLRTRWTDAWDGAESPGCLPAPLQGMVHHGLAPRFRAAGSRELSGFPAGQVIGRFKDVRPVAQMMTEMILEMDAALERASGSAS